MSKPLHQRIRDDLRAQINDGRLRPQMRIPYEHELMQAYECSRMTVNKAISSLVQDGLIERRRRAGSFVLPVPIASTVLDIPDIESDVIGRSEPYHFEIISQICRPSKTPIEIGLTGADGEVMAVQGIHYASNWPLAFEERLINLSAVPDVRNIDLSHQSPGHWLLNHVAWSRVENQVSADNASLEIAQHLKISKHDACLVLERRTWRKEEAITLVKQIFNAKSYRLKASFYH